MPVRFARYFWDCDPATLDLRTHRTYVTERILRYGDAVAVRWLCAHVPPSALRRIVKHSRNLDEKKRA